MTVAEKYSRAIQSSDLRVDGDSVCDADVLIASGWAAQGNNTLSLDLYRMKVTGDMTAFLRIADDVGNSLCRHFAMGPPQLRGLSRVVAIDIARRTLRHWLDDACRPCEGRRHPLIPNSTRLDVSRDCQVCHGTGKRIVENCVESQHREHARWIASVLDKRVGDVFAALAAVLRRQMEF